jgi:hypothetical protein
MLQRTIKKTETIAALADQAALKQFQEILRYSDEQFKRFLQDPRNRKVIMQIKDIAKKTSCLKY